MLHLYRALLDRGYRDVAIQALAIYLRALSKTSN
jgi:hypothetical protein